MTSTIIVDCDGVLLNWRDSFNHWAYAHGWLTSLEQWEPGSYNPPQILGGAERKMMEVFNETHFISKLPPITGAVEALQKFHRNGHPIRVVTAFSDQYSSMKMREDNLINTFGHIFDDIVCLPIGSSKSKYLEKQPKDCFYVEDTFRHLYEAVAVGITPKNLNLISQPWNAAETADYLRDATSGFDKYAERFTIGNWPKIRRNILGE